MRQVAVSVEKLSELVVSHKLVLLGFQFNSRRMTVGLTDKYRAELLDLLFNTWHRGRESFTVKEIEKLIGKLNRAGQTLRAIYHLMSHIYASVAYAMRENQHYLETHMGKFRAVQNR